MALLLKPQASPRVVYDYYEGEYPVVHDATALFEIFKATDWNIWGTKKWVDRKVFQYVDECRFSGIPFGLYHFLRPGDIYGQAMHYLDTVDGLVEDFKDVPFGRPILDVEIDIRKYPGLKSKDWASQVHEWLMLVEQHTQQRPMIYTGYGYWFYLSWLEGKPASRVYPSWCKDYPLWVASYPFSAVVNVVNEPISIPGGWGKKDWWMWQYSDRGRVNGYPANDLSTVSDLGMKGLFGDGFVPPTPPSKRQPPYEVRVTTSPYLRIRENPTTTSRVIGQAPYGSTYLVSRVVEYENGDLWGCVLDPNLNDRWLALVYNGTEKVEVL